MLRPVAKLTHLDGGSAEPQIAILLFATRNSPCRKTSFLGALRLIKLYGALLAPGDSSFENTLKVACSANGFVLQFFSNVPLNSHHFAQTGHVADWRIACAPCKGDTLLNAAVIVITTLPQPNY